MMGGRDNKASGGHSTDPLRWFKELMRLQVIRILAIGAIIAAGVVVALWVVLPALNKPAPVAPVIATPPPSSPAPPAPAVPVEASQPPAPGSGGFDWNEVIPPPPGMMDTVKFQESGLLDANRQPIMSNTALVEKTDDYTHWVCVMGEGKQMHWYKFRYGCGCTVNTSPDPYRDVVYAHPEQVVAEYQSLMCKACSELAGHLDAKESDGGDG